MLSEAAREPYSVLITDDDRSFREAIQEILRPEGFRTILAESGEEALEISRVEPVHLALLDYQLPRLSGLETLRIMRQRNRLLPAIIITGQHSNRLIEEARLVQAFCVISKPVERLQVVCTVQRALRHYYAGSPGAQKPARGWLERPEEKNSLDG